MHNEIPHIAAQTQIQILETTDLHMQILPYDYFADKPLPAVSLLGLTQDIVRLRANAPEGTFLFDNGDFLQGNPLADFAAAHPAPSHPMIAAMNTLDFDAVALGNHEFNYGLPFLQRILAQAKFPVVCANVTDTTGTPLVAPFTSIERMLPCSDGVIRPLRLGVMGVVTPQIVIWDKTVLAGAVQNQDIVQTAQATVPAMQAAGTDIIVALCHAGIDATPWARNMENAALPLAAVNGIDVVLTGHTHSLFPGDSDATTPAIDAQSGYLHGKPSVMAGAYGPHLGAITLTLPHDPSGWSITASDVALHPARSTDQPDALQADITTTVADMHQKTLAHIRQPIASTAVAINSHFATAAPDLSLQLLGDAQRSAVAQAGAGTDWGHLPILSAAAPFRSGGHGGPDHFIDIAPGPLTLRDADAIYPFTNTLYAVRRTGAQIADWLNNAARIFATITDDPDQPLLRKQAAAYDFDVMIGLTYQIDLQRHDNRITDLRYNGIPVADDDAFAVATNSYRANGGGRLVTAPASDILHISRASTRDILIAYLREVGTVDGDARTIWRFAPVGGGQACVLSAPHAQPPQSPHKLIVAGKTPDGFAKFTLQL